VDYLSKYPITILVQDTIIAKELALLFLTYVVRHIGILEIIVSDKGP
jgi:hypothetical protein